MAKFLLGFLSGAIVGGVAAFAKNPLTNNSVRKDIQNAAGNLSDSCDDVRATYSALQEERSETSENIDPETDDEVQVSSCSIKDKAADLVTAIKSVARKSSELNDLVDRVQDLKDTAEIKTYEMQDKINSYTQTADEENEFIQSATPEEQADVQKEQSNLAKYNDFIIDNADKD